MSKTETMTINGVEYVRKDSVLDLSKFVLVRTYSAGVHIGEVRTPLNGKEITLMNTRRLWRWKGALSLSEVAINGIDLEGSKISITVPLNTLTEAIEVIPMSIKASKCIMEALSWKEK